MRTSRALVAAVAAIGLLAAGTSSTAAPAAEPPSVAIADGEIVDTSGQPIGQAFALEEGGATIWILFLSGLEPGLHAMQLHQVGDCSGTFDDVGPQVDGADLGTVSVVADGQGRSSFVTTTDDLLALADDDGFSLVIHERPDNRGNVPSRYQSTDSPDPGPDAETIATGDAGPGIACAEMVADEAFSRAAAEVARARFERAAKAGDPRRSGAAAPRATIDFLHADMFDSSGARRGRVRLVDSFGETTLAPSVTRLDNEVYGVQLHASGACTGTDFADSGPRLPTADVPDLITAGGTDGPISSTFSSVDLPSLASLLQGDGTSVVVHTNPDNHGNIPDRYTASGAGAPGPDATTQSTGDAGAGILCGVFRTVPLAERYIDAVYGYLLGRTVEPAGTARWTSYLERRNRASFASTVAGSLEGRRRRVRVVYLTYLGAEPDASGQAYWAERLGQRGFTEDTLVVSLLSSSRFYEASGGTNREYAEALLGSTLGREPSSGELEMCAAYLDGGGSRWTLASSLVRSDESRSFTIWVEYISAIGRDPSFVEFALWFTYFRRGGQVSALRTFVLASDDFYRVAIDSPFGFAF